jgi:hypothetical protein
MNRFFKTAFGVAILAVVLWVQARLLTDSNHVLFMSEVHAISSMIEDASKSLDDGDAGLASRKLQFLLQRLKEYRAGGSSPEVFIDEFQSL